MKVKIGDTIYNPNDEPILLILSQQDKENIANMAPEFFMYCCYPEQIDREEILKFMDVNYEL